MIAYPSLTDLQLIDLLHEDSEDAFTEIYKRYAERLAGFAATRLYNLDDAHDVIHDLFVGLWLERKSLTIHQTLEGYLFTKVRSRIIDKIRKNITREEYAKVLAGLMVSRDPEVEQKIAVRELEKTIEQALEELSPRVKEIYRLSRESNLSIKEIADRLQLSEQTVKNQLTVALKHLRRSLAYLPITALTLWSLL
jgi:RNA polymerase sigma-70 factor (ECF subfamily)